MSREWYSLPVLFTTVVTLAFVAGACLTFAFGGDIAPHRSADLILLNLRDQAGAAAEVLRRDLIERRREIELLALSTPRRGDGSVDLESLRPFLKRAQDALPFFVIVGYIDATGRIVATSSGEAEGADVSARQYFRAGLLGPYVSDAHPAFLLAKQTGGADALPRLIDVAAPVLVQGKTLGVFSAHLSVDWSQALATEIANRSGLSPTHLTITDAAGQVIARTGEAADTGDEKSLLVAKAAVSGFGDNGASSWTVEAISPRPPLRIKLANLAFWLTGWILASGLGWMLGARIAGAIELHTADIAMLPSRPSSPIRPESIPQLRDLATAIRMAADDLQHEESS